MAVRHLEVEVRATQGGAVLDLRGEINGFGQEALDAAYTEAEAGNSEAIILNFERVDYINSTGIALIVGLLARARASRRRLRMERRRPAPRFRHLAGEIGFRDRYLYEDAHLRPVVVAVLHGVHRRLRHGGLYPL